MCLSGIMYEQDMEEEFNEEEFDRCVVTGELTPYRKTDHIPVSYTHLTLPTSDLV